MRTARNLYWLPALLLLFSCAKETSFEGGKLPVSTPSAGNGGSTGNTSYTYYYKATIGGTNYAEAVTSNNGYIAGSALSGTDDVFAAATICPSAVPYPVNSTALRIEKGILHHYASITDNQFSSFFTPGVYFFSTAQNPGADGTIIYWTGKDGSRWSTMYGSGDQTGSNFQIVTYNGQYDSQGKLTIRTIIQFNCKLYKEATGETKTLTNGEFVGLFKKL